MAMDGRPRDACVVALEESFKGSLFLRLNLSLRIQRFHFLQFFLCETRKMPDEMYELPAIGIFGRVARPPTRHRGEPDAVLNDEEQLSIRHVLGIGQSKIGRLRIHISSDWRLAVAIVPVANRTVIGEVRACFLQGIMRQGNGIPEVPVLQRNSQVSQLSGKEYFKPVWLRLGAETG